MSDTVWEPGDDYIERANVTRLMRRHGIDDYETLVRRSQDDTEWFWDAAIDDLGIDFHQPYSQVLDLGAGPEWARWFIGGRINLAHNCVFRQAASPMRDQPALAWEGEDGATRLLTYADLGGEVARVAAGLEAMGIGLGDVVAVFMPMVPEAVVAAYACACIGAIYLPVFSGFGAPAVGARLADSGARVLLTADGYHRKGMPVPMAAVAAEAAAAAPMVEHTVVLRHAAGPVRARVDGELLWDEAFPEAHGPVSTRELDPETPFMVAYTSGTTGRPKGSVHVHGGFLVKVAEEAAYQTDVGPGEVLYWVTDMGWIMGPWAMVGGHAAGACVFMYDGAPGWPGPDRLWSMCERHGVTTLGVSPTLIRSLIPAGEDAVRTHDLSSLRVLASTGEPWNPVPYMWLSHVVGRDRLPIINLSGGTEVGACFLSGAPVMPTKSCSLGAPALGMAIDVFDPAGRPVRGGVGELVCTKPWPSMTRGFWRDPERYLAAYWKRWPGVWAHGDWASVDVDGFWFLHGRSDDTLMVAGKRIGPAEFESAAVNHPAVIECAAIGVPDAIKGEAVWCFCVLGPEAAPGPALAAEIAGVVAGELGKAFRPAQVRFVEELPKTRSAKILRRVVRSCVLGEDPGDLSSLENPGALEALEAVLR
ncbi:MAG: AMP-binding protein [Actinomycetota bacterium]|nr:AMP-binding protein [Actinomycetota bacterium]